MNWDFNKLIFNYPHFLIKTKYYTMKHTKNIFLISSLILTMLNAHVGSPASFKVYQPDGKN